MLTATDTVDIDGTKLAEKVGNVDAIVSCLKTNMCYLIVQNGLAKIGIS